MRYWAIVCLFLIIGCGDEQDINDPSQLTYILCDISDPPFLVPEKEEEITYMSRPYMYFTPRELIFYYDSTTVELPLTHTIRICNATNEIVVITNAYISNEDSIYGGENDKDYFTLSPVDLPKDVITNECLSMDITFIYSARQRGAQLVVHTSFDPYNKIIASLSGKIFFF